MRLKTPPPNPDHPDPDEQTERAVSMIEGCNGSGGKELAEQGKAKGCDSQNGKSDPQSTLYLTNEPQGGIMSIQFSRLNPPCDKITPQNIKRAHLQSIKLCKCCGIREPGGYIGNGTILNDICSKCFRNKAIGRNQAKMPTFYNREGRS